MLANRLVNKLFYVTVSHLECLVVVNSKPEQHAKVINNPIRLPLKGPFSTSFLSLSTSSSMPNQLYTRCTNNHNFKLHKISFSRVNVQQLLQISVDNSNA
jgi:hypothetical protein